MHRAFYVAAIVVFLSLNSQAVAADAIATVISIPGIHCGGCAKKIEAKLKLVPGVASVVADANGKTATVVPVAGKALSARAQWDAVEKAGYKPSKLVGPQGKFEAKPSS